MRGKAVLYGHVTQCRSRHISGDSLEVGTQSNDKTHLTKCIR